MKPHALYKTGFKGILRVGLSGALVGLFLAARPAAAEMVRQQVIAEASSPNATDGQWHRRWSRQQEEHVLAEAKRALAARDAAPLLSLFNWDGVTPESRRNTTRAVKELVKRKIESVVVQPKGLGGNIDYVKNGQVYKPNGTVLAHLSFKPDDGAAGVDLPLGLKGEKLVLLGYSPNTAR